MEAILSEAKTSLRGFCLFPGPFLAFCILINCDLASGYELWFSEHRRS